MSLGEIVLVTLMSTGLLLLRGQSREAWRDHARNNDVARLIALVTIMSLGLRDRARDDDLARLGEIAGTTMTETKMPMTTSFFYTTTNLSQMHPDRSADRTTQMKVCRTPKTSTGAM